ncbi:MAG: hypothetical protein WCT03_22940 [Candidatus Obscuribacterales bacterium]|jgi:hypothetical protein
MDHCQKQRIKFTALRGLLSVTAGVICWFLLGAAATKFGLGISANQTLFVGAALTIIAWFSTKPMFRFTEECMSMKVAKGERNIKPVNKSNPPLNRLATRPAAAAVKTLKPAADCPVEIVQGGQLISKNRVTVTITKNDTGRSVAVVMRGVGSGEFKGNSGVRARLESIPGIKWSFPKNDPTSGVRTIEGVITPSAANEKVAACLIAVANHIG